MTATEQLREEHEGIKLMLAILGKFCDMLGAGEKVNPNHAEGMLEFFQVFADKCHHGKEENLLFKAMVDRGFPRQAGPIAVMLHEHETGRAFIRGIAEAAAALGTDPGAVRRVVENGRGYIELLRGHIHKENNILFPMADNVLSAEDQERLGEEFERFETEETGHGVHEAMLKLLAELKAGVQ